MLKEGDSRASRADVAILEQKGTRSVLKCMGLREARVLALG